MLAPSNSKNRAPLVNEAPANTNDPDCPCHARIGLSMLIGVLFDICFLYSVIRFELLSSAIFPAYRGSKISVAKQLSRNI